MRLAAFKDLTRIEQTLFAFPFALGGAFLSLSDPCSFNKWIAWAWIIPAVLLARIAGMAFNQLIDRHIDACNPRTKNRVIPTGRVTLLQARCVAWGALALFLILCFQLNTLTALLSLVAAFLLYIYSYMKRMNLACHFVLGGIHFLGPVMAYTGITGAFSLSSFFLGGAASLLIVGTDIAYAIQDYAFDCQHRLFSIPSRLGIKKSLLIAAGMHFFCPFMLLGVGLSAHLPLVYFFVLPIVGGVLFAFQRTLNKDKSFKRIEPSFFLCNSFVSCSSLFFIVISILWDVLL